MKTLDDLERREEAAWLRYKLSLSLPDLEAWRKAWRALYEGRKERGLMTLHMGARIW